MTSAEHDIGELAAKSWLSQTNYTVLGSLIKTPNHECDVVGAKPSTAHQLAPKLLALSEEKREAAWIDDKGVPKVLVEVETSESYKEAHAKSQMREFVAWANQPGYLAVVFVPEDVLEDAKRVLPDHHEHHGFHVA